MKLLEQSFLAVMYTGEEVSIFDIEQLIKDNGLNWFLSTFGISHNIRSYNEAENEHNEHCQAYTLGLRKDYPFKNHICFAFDLCYQFRFILIDGKGNCIAPREIAEEFIQKYPKSWMPKWKRNTCKKNRINRDIGYHKGCDHRMLKAYYGTLISEGEPQIKKKKVLYTHPWDGLYEKRGQRNWKSFRKSQYK